MENVVIDGKINPDIAYLMVSSERSSRTLTLESFTLSGEPLDSKAYVGQHADLPMQEYLLAGYAAEVPKEVEAKLKARSAESGNRDVIISVPELLGFSLMINGCPADEGVADLLSTISLPKKPFPNSLQHLSYLEKEILSYSTLL